jgi:hypothetical protein
VVETKTVVRLCDLSDSSETSDLLVPACSHMRTRAQPHQPLQSKARVCIHLQAVTNEVFHNLVRLFSAETRCA